MSWPSWNEFISGLREFEQKLSDGEVKGIEYIKKFKERYPILNEVVKGAIPIIPPPISNVIQGIYDKAEDPEIGAIAILNYLAKLENLQKEHYEHVISEIEFIKTNMATKETQILIKEILISTSNILQEKLRILRQLEKDADKIKEISIDTNKRIFQLEELNKKMYQILIQQNISTHVERNAEIIIPSDIVKKINRIDERQNELQNEIIKNGKNPKIDTELLLKKSTFFYNQRDYKKCLFFAEVVLEFESKNLDALNNKANALDNLGDHEDAVEVFNQAIKINQDYDYAWYNKGILLTEQGHYENALDAYNRAILLKPDYEFAVWSNKGAVLRDLERYEESIEASSRAIKLKPDISETWFNKGLAQGSLGMFKESKISFQEAVKINPNSMAAKNALELAKQLESQFNQ